MRKCKVGEKFVISSFRQQLFQSLMKHWEDLEMCEVIVSLVYDGSILWKLTNQLYSTGKVTLLQ